MLVVALVDETELTHVDVANSTDDCHGNCPEDAQPPYESSDQNVQNACLAGRFDSILPNLGL